MSESWAVRLRVAALLSHKTRDKKCPCICLVLCGLLADTSRYTVRGCRADMRFSHVAPGTGSTAALLMSPLEERAAAAGGVTFLTPEKAKTTSPSAALPHTPGVPPSASTTALLTSPLAAPSTAAAFATPPTAAAAAVTPSSVSTTALLLSPTTWDARVGESTTWDARVGELFASPASVHSDPGARRTQLHAADVGLPGRRRRLHYHRTTSDRDTVPPRWMQRYDELVLGRTRHRDAPSLGELAR